MQQLYGVLAFLAKISNKKYVSKRRQQMLAPAVDYMLEQYSDSAITNDFLAQRLGISEVYLRKLFAAHLGVTPKQYILDLRIRTAQQLLTGTTKTVTEISEACGYLAISSFYRNFKKYYNVTPSEFKEATTVTTAHFSDK